MFSEAGWMISGKNIFFAFLFFNSITEVYMCVGSYHNWQYIVV